MTRSERIHAITEGKSVDRAGISGWLHMPLVDREPEAFTKETIDFTEKMNWDFIKVMSNGHYFADAYGAKIRWRNDPREWSGEFLEYPVKTVSDLVKLPVIDPLSNPVFRREIQAVENLCKHYKGETPVLATVFTPITWLQEMIRSTVPAPTLQLMAENKKEVHQALEALTETNIKLLDQFMDAGIDGIFLSTQYGTRALVSDAQYEEFEEPYTSRILDHIKERTWFNMLHVHYCENLMFDKLVKLEGIQAYNWENCTAISDKRRLKTIQEVRSLTDKVIIGGIDQHNDFRQGTNDRESVKEVLRRRLMTSLEECGDYKFIFAPGCALPLDVDRSIFTLLNELIQEYGLAK